MKYRREKESMQLSKEFTKRLSEIFFNEEMNGEQMENRLSEIFLNKDMNKNLLNDNDLKEV